VSLESFWDLLAKAGFESRVFENRVKRAANVGAVEKLAGICAPEKIFPGCDFCLRFRN
jgi:hypothetical protein